MIIFFKMMWIIFDLHHFLFLYYFYEKLRFFSIFLRFLVEKRTTLGIIKGLVRRK